ncbi:hypothetical protein [Chitinophaga nivalis]|uniref:Outer membrane protein beta-barrel domain-containing protein n=1 Tax=Chitinophaga nivalis TaxID=2991709 RepID=A0ABT3IT37_9BACT|nr:hypothetical protein [Chitinophaga nivalis]MCW3463166.1 hypothetical protein [Chitinophaga nivalis]MCW3487144.1 hypothetical protein [Chitinophaga nivalis]
MRKILLAVALSIVALSVKAQEIQTLTSRPKSAGKTKVGGYGTALGKITGFDGTVAIMTGAYGGVLLNKKFLLGAGAYSLINKLEAKASDGGKYNLWYTGFVFEYVHHSDKLFHWSAGTLIGGGGLTEQGKKYKVWEDGWEKDKYRYTTAHGFFVAEPFVNVELNISRNIRLVGGGSYRFAVGAGGNPFSDNQLSAPSFHLGIKAGVF